MTIKSQTVADTAQVFADFSGSEVRVPRSLINRPLAFASGYGNATARQVVDGLNTPLEMYGVEVVQLGPSVVAFRQGRTFQEKMLAMIPAEANPGEVTRARAAMSNDRFWDLIESARRRGRNDPSEMAEALTTALRRLRAEEIFGFHILFHERMAEAYRWDLWAVAYIVNGGASDDGFEYFRAWLVSQGRAYFEAALKDPERAADRASLDQRNACEEIISAAIQAYQTKTKRLPPAIPAPATSTTAETAGPAGKKWNEEDLPKMFPNLVKKFR